MKIKNKDELDEWMFEHAALKGHLCVRELGELPDGSTVNVAWKDTVSQERIEIIYED